MFPTPRISIRRSQVKVDDLRTFASGLRGDEEIYVCREGIYVKVRSMYVTTLVMHDKEERKVVLINA